MGRPGVWVLGLVACLGCGSSDDARGRVVGLDGRPFRSVPVRVTGCPDQVTTADGTFDARCATSPYDVAVKPSANTGVVYQGLTRRDPVVTVPYTYAFDDWVTVSGSLAGHDPARPAQVVVTTPAGNAFGSYDASGGGFSAVAYWRRGEPASATVRALEWTETAQGLAAFTGYGTADFPLVSGELALVSPLLQPIANGAITVATDAPAPGTLSLELWATWPEGGSSRIGAVNPGAPRGTVATPAIAGTSFTVLARQTGDPERSAWRQGLPATASPAAMALPAAVTFTSPSAGATVDATTAFRFGAMPGAVYRVAFRTSVQGGPMLDVITRETSVRMPDFTWAGLPAPAGVTVQAVVSAVGPLASVDELASATFASLPEWWGWAERVPTADGFATRSSIALQAR